MFLAVLALFLQDLRLTQTWEDLAKPWMTDSELALFNSLDSMEQRAFRGVFVSRRLADPQNWPASGLYLPELHCPKTFGDIRDQIHYALGAPKTATPMPQNPKIPGTWHYDHTAIHFRLHQGKKVVLAEQSIATWNSIKAGRVKHPHLRYGFSSTPFGRTRLPENTVFMDTQVLGLWQTPDPRGATFHITLSIPEAYKQYLRGLNTNPKRNMELIVKLGSGEGNTAVGKSTPERHGSREVDLLMEHSVTFQVHLPPGFFAAELLMYSGFFEKGLRATRTIAVKPPELPRIGDPIITQQWLKAGLTEPATELVSIGDTAYLPAHTYRPNMPARVLVHSRHKRTEVHMQGENQLPQPLTLLESEGPWWVYQMPPQKHDYRIISLGFSGQGETIALGATGTFQGSTDLTGFAQNDTPNYLAWDHLAIEPQSDLILAFVNGTPLAASTSGRFPWPSFDWGALARLRFEYAKQGSWFAANYDIRRNAVFEEVRVKPQFIVAGTKTREGSPKAVPIEISVVGQPVQINKATPYSSLNKLWGIVVNDPLLKSAIWPQARELLLQWLKTHTGPKDLIYIIHNTHRPEMVLNPTTFKPLVQASLNALTPKTKRKNVFTIQYFIDALTHLKHHHTRPHQVIMLTDRLSGEVKQIEDLMPKLRSTGLQLYNLEFPFLESGGPEAQMGVDNDPLTTMAENAEKDPKNRAGMHDSFMETRSTPPLLTWSFGKKKANRESRQAAILDDAFQQAFNQQLAALTAGLGLASTYGESTQSLHRFFQNLTDWQKSLVHLDIALPYLDADLVRIAAQDGYTAGWTLVEWQPEQTAVTVP